MSAASDPWGVYVHVPWCRARCPYCSFAIVPERGAPDWSPFVARALAEWDARRAAWPGDPTTVFLGGGTPSRLPPAALEQLLAGIGAPPGAEISAEANPEDVDDAWVDGALAAGITRLSLGLQTLDPDRAKLLGRAHTVRQAHRAIAAIERASVPSWSVDLIFATPGQTLADLERELDAVLVLEPPHVSLYGLTFEPGTAFERARRRGRLTPVGDDAWRAMYERIVDRLRGAGLERYEVSNFARPGHRCRHNQLYWNDRPYLGIGPSAHSYRPDGLREADHADLAVWIDAADPVAERDRPDAQQAATDHLVSCLRGVDGVSLQRLAARTGLRPDPQTVEALQAAGLVRVADAHLCLTDAGYPVCDAIVARLSDTLVDAR